MSALYTQVVDAFARAGWACRAVEGRTVVESDFEAHHGKIPLHVQVFPEFEAIAVVSRSSMPVEAARRVKVAELLMRVNKELTVGNFEIDWDEGTVMFRAGNVFGKGGADAELVAGLVRTAVVEMDRMTPLLGEIARTPEAALPRLDVVRLMLRDDLLPAPAP